MGSYGGLNEIALSRRLQGLLGDVPPPCAVLIGTHHPSQIWELPGVGCSRGGVVVTRDQIPPVGKPGPRCHRLALQTFQ
eukprot:755545-Hanusia_phi.AAC.3